MPRSPSETRGFYKALTHVLSTQNERESRDWPQALRREPGTAGSVKRAVTCVAWALVQLLLGVTLAPRCRASQVWEVPGSSLSHDRSLFISHLILPVVNFPLPTQSSPPVEPTPTAPELAARRLPRWTLGTTTLRGREGRKQGPSSQPAPGGGPEPALSPPRVTRDT